MANYGELLLSKVLENDAVHMLRKHQIAKEHFPTALERDAYLYIIQYAEQNNGKAPSPSVAAAEAEFEYTPNVTDSYQFLARQLKDYAAKHAITLLVQDKAAKVFDEKGGVDFGHWMQAEIAHILRQNQTTDTFGTQIKTDTEKFMEEYQKRKEGKSNRIWKSKFPTINRAVGGYTASNLFTFFARSGKGKSLIAVEEIVEIAMNGGHVLIWSLEMGFYEMLVRIFSSISGRLGLFQVHHDGQKYDGGFEQRALNHGKLDPAHEAAFEAFLANMDQYIPGSITLRSVDDQDFPRRNCDQLEADIISVKEQHGACDAVLIDPIYLMEQEKTRSTTNGAEVAATSQRLRRIAGEHALVLMTITQADEDKTIEGKDGKQTEIRIPPRASIKKSKAVLEDSRLVFALDSLDGRAMLSISKSREGGETQVEMLFLPSYGIIREFSADEINLNQFEDTF